MRAAHSRQQQVDQVADAFLLAKGTSVTDPDLARDWCLEVSEEFAAACLAAAIPAEVITGAKFGEMPEFPGIRLLMHGHCATLVTIDEAQVVYDWTARQFNPAVPVPLVQSLSEWRQEWSHPQSW